MRQLRGTDLRRPRRALRRHGSHGTRRIIEGGTDPSSETLGLTAEADTPSSISRATPQAATQMHLYMRGICKGRCQLLPKRWPRGASRRHDMRPSETIEANLRLVVSHRQALRGPRPALPRLDPGGQPGPHPGGREVRLPARLQVQHLRHLVDPPGRSPVASPTRRAPSASRCTWWRRSASSLRVQRQLLCELGREPSSGARSPPRWASRPQRVREILKMQPGAAQPGEPDRRGRGLTAGRLHRRRAMPSCRWRRSRGHARASSTAVLERR